jgi:hypothetical protein
VFRFANRFGQTLDSSPVAAQKLGPQLIEVTSLAQHLGQPPSGVFVAGVGAFAQAFNVTLLGQQIGSRSAAGRSPAWARSRRPGWR